MIWPWISREVLNEAKQARDLRIAALEKQIADLTEDRKRMVDILGVRALGLSIYGTIQMPKEEADEPEPTERRNEATGELEQPPPPPLHRARSIAQRQQAVNIETYSREQQEALRLIELAQEAGRAAASAEAVTASTNGNGNHS